MPIKIIVSRLKSKPRALSLKTQFQASKSSFEAQTPALRLKYLPHAKAQILALRLIFQPLITNPNLDAESKH